MKYFLMFCGSVLSMIFLFIFAIGIVHPDGFLFVLFVFAFIMNFMGIVTNAVKVIELLDKAEKKK